MKHFSYIIALLNFSFITSCGNDSAHYGVDAREINTYLNNELINERPQLKITNDALGRDFMLYGAFIPMLNSPTGHSLKGRIIKFEVGSDRMFMLESPKGHAIGDALDNYILLAEFPILRTDDDGVVIDFAKGMTSAFTMRNVHSRSVAERESSTTEQFRAIFLSASYVRSIEADQGVLTINQVAQWRNQKSELVSAEFRYYFREYMPSLEYEKKTFGKQRWVQYFSTPPLLAPPSSQAFAYITKWDLTEPIIFYISANTPPEYRDAIRDGLVFWNHIFGKEVVIVRDLSPSISAPHPKLNILQWIKWDNEASAYADMVVDHLTGQVLQAQIYLRSGWVIESARKLKNQLEELLISEQQNDALTALEEDVPLPSMFDYEEPCLQTMTSFDEIADLATKLSKNKISQETLVVITGDILRAVIAHEMGHVLGLRHNLAGSTSGSMTLLERDTITKSYLQTGIYEQSPDKFFSRSIMDVFSAGDDAIVGAQMRELLKSENVANSQLRTIYRHDQEAIDYGYYNKAMPGDMVFCTDDDIPVYLDCRRWDAGANPIQFASERLNSIMTQIAIIMADTFITAIDPKRNGGPIAIKDIPLTSRNVLKVVDAYTKEFLLWYNKASRSALVESQLPAFGPQTEEAITQEKFKLVRNETDMKGAAQTLFAMLPPFRTANKDAEDVVKSFRAHFLVRLEELKLEHPNFSLSDEDVNLAVSIATNFLDTLNKDIIKLILGHVAKAQFDDKDYQLPIEDALGKIAAELVLATDAHNEDSLPHFRYDLATRELGAQILNPALGVLTDFSFEAGTKVGNDLKQLMRRVGVSGGDGKDAINLNALSREQRQWFLEQNQVLNALFTIRSMTRKAPTTSK